MLRKGRLVVAPSPAGVGTPPVPEKFSTSPISPAGALAPVPLGFRGAGDWLGSRGTSTLLAFLAIFTMGPLILLSTLSVNSFYAAVTTASNLRLTDASALAAVYVSTQMTSLAAVDDSYARRPTLIAALGDGNHANFDKTVILTALNGIRAIQLGTRFAGIVDAAGTYWGDQDPAGPASAMGQNFSMRDWYQGAARTGAAYISTAYVSADQGSPLVVAIADQVKADGRYAPKGTVVGILVVGYYLTAMQRLFSDFARNQGVSVTVTDQMGVVVAQSDAVPTKLVQDKSAGVTAALNGKNTLVRVTIGGEDQFASYSPVATVGWTTVTSVPVSVALADASRLRTYMIAITIILLALLAAAKVILYLVFRDRQAVNLSLTGANSGLSESVAARTAELETSNRQLVGRTAELVGRSAELEASNQQLEGRTAELEASNRELEAFGYSVSHDLRSPLRSIDGFSRLVLEENQSELSTEGTRRLGLIRAGAQQMGILIDDLLSFSRLGRVELKKRRVFTADIVKEVISELKQENPDRQIDFIVQDLPPCLADPVLLRQVFRNLLGNAVKFSRTRPDARIEVGSDAGTDTAKAGMVMYYVKDNGVGFDMQFSDKLFGVFQRLHRMEDFPGTGVGLALVRRIVERHGGKVWAKGAADAGATFYLTLEDGDART